MKSHEIVCITDFRCCTMLLRSCYDLVTFSLRTKTFLSVIIRSCPLGACRGRGLSDAGRVKSFWLSKTFALSAADKAADFIRFHTIFVRGCYVIDTILYDISTFFLRSTDYYTSYIRRAYNYHVRISYTCVIQTESNRVASENYRQYRSISSESRNFFVRFRKINVCSTVPGGR